MIRFFDFFFALLGLLLTLPILITIYCIGLFDTGSPLFRQIRVGVHKKPFVLIKFRTMSLETESVSSHLADSSSITRLGFFLRRSKLDELPQLWNVLNGDMSLVGPRPGLFNQKELLVERESRGVFDILPGITGLSQISGIDMSQPSLLAKTDSEMIKEMTLKKYFFYIFQTVIGKGVGDSLKR